MSSFESWISQDGLLRTDYAMIALTSTVFVVRLVVQTRRRRRFEWQDAWLFLAFAAFITFSSLYVKITPVFFKIEAVQEDPTNPANMWPGMQEDIIFASRVMWSSGMIFWTCLWSVKFSLLALYKKLLAGLPNTWIWLYWGIVGFCILTYISCFLTGPAIACEHTKAFLEDGVMCYSETDTRHQTASMYYAFAVDAVTNLMVMFLPIRLVWPLQMPQHRKIGVCILFALGFICILFSTIRIVQITDGKTKSPDPKWLTMWTVIECSTAVIIGCSPMLAAIIPKSESNGASYDTHGYVRQSASRSNTSVPNSVGLKPVHSPETLRKNFSSELSWIDTNDSDEDVPSSHSGIHGKSAMQEEEDEEPTPQDEQFDARRKDPRNVRQLRRMR